MKIKHMVLTAIFSAMTAVGAFIQIPMWPASATLQTMFTAAAGILLGSKLGALSQALYLLLGLFGLPIFTKGSGFGYIIQPTFGFLLALPVTAWIAGYIYKKNNSAFGAVTACTAAYLSLYAIGVPYMWLIVNRVNNVNMTFITALRSGMLLFLPGDILKIILVSYLSVKLKKIKLLTL